jgi:hypothetical protein
LKKLWSLQPAASQQLIIPRELAKLDESLLEKVIADLTNRWNQMRKESLAASALLSLFEAVTFDQRQKPQPPMYNLFEKPQSPDFNLFKKVPRLLDWVIQRNLLFDFNQEKETQFPTDAEENKKKKQKEKERIEAIVDICPFYHHKYQPDDTAFSCHELAIVKKYGAPPLFQKDRPNLKLGLLGVNKELSARCSEFFYSRNVFLFNDPRSCFWFFRRIGDDNLRNIRTAVFNISGGFFLSKETRSFSDISDEQRWCEALEMLRLKHGLRKCVIRFIDMEDYLNDEDTYSITEQWVMTKARCEIVATLCRFRDLKEVHVENQRCDFLSPWERRNMVNLMTTSSDLVAKKPDEMEKSVFEKRCLLPKP